MAAHKHDEDMPQLHLVPPGLIDRRYQRDWTRSDEVRKQAVAVFVVKLCEVKIHCCSFNLLRRDRQRASRLAGF